ncbi:Spt20 domain-containing protein [Cephalotus follicularis]|uniref:Spt20 domain-containing protein n=1 Tax=Cephalotus follicularis TaxID=3775 RepID=A0A1Q3BD55_CEPFO|nr:Spt20 domain-containing protein [Cephalotus follicularis]
MVFVEITDRSEREMGVKFKVARTGTRYIPKVVQTEEDQNHENVSVTDSQQRNDEGNFSGVGDKVADKANLVAKSRLLGSEDIEVSFSLNLFPNGFSVGKATEMSTDIPKHLHPYNRASETLFTPIEYEWLPGNIFDGIPCKYVNGALHCEIRDYRNCFVQRAGKTSVQHSPVVHKVRLKMCMENVVKDILSISNNSLTYEDLMEVESRILKALQPDLHLNPEPLLDRFRGEHHTKKLNLGISWGWKRRKVDDTSRNNIRHHETHIRGIGGTQNSKLKPSVTYPDRGDPCRLQTTSSSIPYSKENNVVLEALPQYTPLAKNPSNQLGDHGNQSVYANLPPSINSAIPQQCFNINTSFLRDPSSLVLAETGKCETQVIEGPILKKPKEEPAELSELLLPIPCKNNLWHHQINPKQVVHERSFDKGGPSPLINCGQQAILEGIPKLQAVSSVAALKQEPAERSDFPNSNVEMMMKLRSSHSKVYQDRQQFSSLTRAEIPPHTNWNPMVHPINKNSNKLVTQKRKALDYPQAAGGVRSRLNESLPRQVSLPAKQKKNNHSQCSSMKTVNSLADSSKIIVAKSSRLPLGILPLPISSKVKGDPLLERFLKIQAVTERYGLNNKKCRADQILPGNQLFGTTQLIACQLWNSAKNGKLENATDGTYLSQCYVDRKLNLYKTRTMTFVHPSHVNRGNDNPMVGSEGQIKLVIAEKLDEGIVDARVLYKNLEELDSIAFPLPGSCSEDLFAAQFASLMVRDGYVIASDHIEHIPLNASGSSSSRHPTVIGSGTSAAGTPELLSSILLPELSTSLPLPLPLPIPIPLTGSMSSFNLRQLALQNFLSGGHLLPPGNFQPTLQLPASDLYNSQLDITADVNPAQPHRQQILNKHAHLQFQMIQREVQREQFLKRKTMAEGLDATMGGLGSGIQAHGNFNLGLPGNAMGIGPMTAPMGGQLPWIGSVGHFNNFGSYTPSLNNSNQFMGVTSDHPAEYLARLRMTEGQGRAFPGGYSFQKNAGVVPTYTTVPDMAHLLSNHQQSHPQMPHQLQMLPPQQEMRLLLQPQESARLSELVGSPLWQVSAHQLDQQPELSSQQLSVSALWPINNGDTLVDPECSGLSWRAHGSAVSSNASPSRDTPSRDTPNFAKNC